MNRLIAGLTGIFVLLIVFPAHSFADTTDDEIRYLIGSVGRDGCAFIRNNRKYSRRQAREHLRSKWRLNERLVESAEDFIEKIASRSVTSGQHYRIQCRREQHITAEEWFAKLLAKYRADIQG